MATLRHGSAFERIGGTPQPLTIALLWIVLSLASSQLGAQPHTIDAQRSKVTFRVGASTGDVTGENRQLRGLARFDSSGMPVTASLDLDAAAFATGIFVRNMNLRTTLQAADHPTITFALDRAIRAGVARPSDADGTPVLLEGHISLRGITRPVRIRGMLARIERGYRFHGRFELLLSEYGIPRPAFLFTTVDDRVSLDIVAVFTRF